MDGKDAQDIDLEQFGGDARAASEAIAGWLAQRPAPPQMSGVLAAIRAALEQLLRAPVVRDDAEAMRIIAEMTLCRDMEELAAQVDRLGARLDALLAGEGDRPAAAPEQRRRPTRTLLRL